MTCTFGLLQCSALVNYSIETAQATSSANLEDELDSDDEEDQLEGCEEAFHHLSCSHITWYVRSAWCHLCFTICL